MKEQIHTIPIHDAFNSDDECPFCYLERMAEQNTVRYVLGPSASYMEPNVRSDTDRDGFCGHHFKMMYDYGNALGNALIMQTYYASLLAQLEDRVEHFSMPATKPLFGKRKEEEEPILTWAKHQEESCFICGRVQYHMRRYCAAFFELICDAEFRAKVERSKGFCMHHFTLLLEQAHDKLPNSQREWFYPALFKLMKENLTRIKGDIDHFVSMFDYRSAGKDWGNSKDAVSRGMQKLRGIHPADPPYKAD